ncbi:TPA: hypothetical protein EYP12_00875, partial [Candidatus Bipolaricaulota bacterium]|nr:hypothetical protein [Candidatus Bipolaricaulota bacterium]
MKGLLEGRYCSIGYVGEYRSENGAGEITSNLFKELAQVPHELDRLIGRVEAVGQPIATDRAATALDIDDEWIERFLRPFRQ